MNALELADMLAGNSSDFVEAAEMLRRQHEVIKQLRDALESIQRMSYDNSAQAKVCEKALADTEEI